MFFLPNDGMFIEYNRARYVLRDLIGDEADITVYKEAFVKMKATAVTISPNKLIVKNLKVEEYETWKDMQESITRSKYKNLTNFIKAMFIHFGLYNEDLDDSEEEELDEKHLDLFVHRKVNRT